MSNKLTEFQSEPVLYVETIDVKEGVSCDVYKFDNDEEKDLAIVTISAGSRTPLQKINKGDKTIEGYISGKGLFILNGQSYKVYDDLDKVFEVSVGDVMQWQAEEDLVFFEICYPPYQEGRFTNLEE